MFAGAWYETAVESLSQSVKCGLPEWGIQVLDATLALNGAEWADIESEGGLQIGGFLPASEWGHG
jgi:hypothetical protein